ncbi:MAG: IreB family regulatory phosphoprotein [Clostridia bacterium]|nr:IreB family regulatory phosphoprotein [Clostridia bacterium]
MIDGTQTFNIKMQSEDAKKAILQSVYDALSEKGYNPVNQIVGYLLSEDPTYITNHKDARSLIRKLDRDELLKELVRSYLSK